MERRKFMKGALIAAAVITSGKAFAGEYEKGEGRKVQKLLKSGKLSALEQKHVPTLRPLRLLKRENGLMLR